MSLQSRALAAALGAVAILSLSACNGGGSSLNPFVAQRGTLRFINGSPDAGTVNVAIGGPNASAPNWSNVPYAGKSQDPATNSNAGITSYVQFNAPTQSIFIYNSTTSAQISVPQSSVTITPNGRTTVVLTGSVAAKNLRLVSFSEHLFQTVAGAGSVAFHHAAQQFSTITYTVGYQATGSGSTQTCSPAFTTISPPILFGASPPTSREGVPPAPSGVMFCAQGGGALLTLLPSQVDGSDAGNVMPFSGPTSVNGDQNLSIYLIDGPLGSGKPTLVGVFDPNK